jgi:hypothetical protein
MIGSAVYFSAMLMEEPTMRGRWFIPIAVVPLMLAVSFMLIAARATPGVYAAAAMPEAVSSTGCVSDWYVSYSGTSSWTLINTDPDGLSLSDLYFSRSYNDPTDLSRGYLDFNRDGKSDVFSAVPIAGGFYQWRYSSGATSPWIDLAFDTTPPDQLRFGDFNGDGFTDVFATTPRLDGDLQWEYSPGGASSYVNLAHDSTPLDQLRFGDFNGDGRTDVLALKDIGSGYLGWNVSYSGTTNFVQINSAQTPLSEMQFGDINGDGHTDIFTTISNTTYGEWEWFYSSAGSGAYQPIVLTNLNVHDVLLAGNFDTTTNGINLFHNTDFFYTTPQLDGTWQWWYDNYRPSPFLFDSNVLAYDSTPPDQLRFGDFNGDGVTDVFKLVRRCTVYLPVVQR